MASESLESFSIAFLKMVLQENKDGNIFYSPLSIVTAFYMLLLGTNNESSNQIIKALKYKKSINEIHKEISEMLDKTAIIMNEYDQTQLSIANGLFMQNNFKIKANYQKELQNFYKSEMIKINFTSPTAVKEVNQWIESKTNDKIKDMFQEGSFNDLTRLVLANAVYFKSNFKDGFEIGSTVDKSFHKDVNTKLTIKMMKTSGDYHFAEDSKLGLKVLEIPFKNYHMRFLLFLPTQRFGLNSVLDKLKENDLKSIINSLKLRQVSTLEVPKFKIDTELNLKNLMSLLGVKDIFDPNKADLKGISDGNLFVDKAIHKTFLDVNEHGVEAAAATAMSICLMSMPFYESNEPLEFIVDEPYLLSVYHKSADAIVFIGRVNEPK